MSREWLQGARLDDPFWAETQRLLQKTVLPYQWEILNDRVPGAAKSGCISNFRIAAGLETGSFYGEVFQDSDLYKWLEAVAYALKLERDESLEALADGAIALIEKAQLPSGYLDTYYQIKAPQEKFRNLTEGHELYCAGHLMEAAVAYHQATGKDALLHVACRLADHLCEHFMDGQHGYSGNPEVELALIRLCEETGEQRYAQLCQAMLDARGQGLCAMEDRVGGFTPVWGHGGAAQPEYLQDHLPVRQQRQAEGHAVRALYLYSGMADMARLSGEHELLTACEALYDDVTHRQMYVTGGVGSCADGERFTSDYDLPNDTAYAETCASVALMMFSRRMWRLGDDPKCYDVWEKALYNTVLAGMSRDGKHFFYVNPLSSDPTRRLKNPLLRHVLPERPQWYFCACCPPNLTRCVLSLGDFLYAREGDTLTVLSPIASHVETNDLSLRLEREGERGEIVLRGPALTLRLRIPAGYRAAMDGAVEKGGYLCITHAGGEASYAFTLSPVTRVLHAHPRIAADAGKVCVCRGETVYCLEEKDNGAALCELRLPKNAVLREVQADWLPKGMVALQAGGYRLCADGWTEPYAEEAPQMKETVLHFVPYSQWNNRGIGEMTVWVHEC